jgi:hypothetical protein
VPGSCLTRGFFVPKPARRGMASARNLADLGTRSAGVPADPAASAAVVTQSSLTGARRRACPDHQSGDSSSSAREHVVPRGGRGCPGDLLDLAAGLRGLLGRESLPGRSVRQPPSPGLWHLGNRVAS